MASRIFSDRTGTLWTVWDVVPGTHNKPDTRQLSTLPEEMSGGWLCFESQAGKRRFYPIPPAWEELPDDKLEFLCRAAVPVGRPHIPKSEPPPAPDAAQALGTAPMAEPPEPALD